MAGNSDLSLQRIYYPSMVVDLQVLFDEGGKEKAHPTPKSPRETAKYEIGAVQLATGVAEIGAVQIQTPQYAIGPVQIGSQSPSAPDAIAESTNPLSHLWSTVPRSASVELPSYRQAGTFNLEFLHRDFPIDPRIVRAMRATIYLGTVSALAWGDGATGTTFSGRRTSVLNPDRSSTREQLLVGMADTIHAEFSDRGSVIKIDGRDLRGTLLDLPISPVTLEKIDLEKPLDEVVQYLVDKLHPLGANIKVETDPSEWPDGKVPSPHVRDDLTRANKNAEGSASMTSTPADANTINYWDLITQWSFICGAIPYFVGDRIRIRPSRSLYDQLKLDGEANAKFPYPFADSSGNPTKRPVRPPLVDFGAATDYGFRRMVFGHDIMSLRFERKLAGVKLPTIRVVSIDPDSAKGVDNRLLDVSWPDAEDSVRRASTVGPSGKNAATNEIYVTVYGIKNKKRLLDIAKALRVEISKQELGGSVTTKNLSSFGGGNHDADLLRLRPGDPIELLMNASGLAVYPPPISELTNVAAMGRSELVKFVKERLGQTDDALAEAVADSLTNAYGQLQSVFRVGNVKFSWQEGIVEVSFDFQNYVEVRDSDPDQKPAATVQKIEIGNVYFPSDVIGTPVISSQVVATIGEPIIGGS